MSLRKLTLSQARPPEKCKICGVPYAYCSAEKHLRASLMEFGAILRAKKEKELIWKNRRGPEKASARLIHNRVIRELRIGEATLPAAFRFCILTLDILKAKSAPQQQLEQLSAIVAPLIQEWYKSSNKDDEQFWADSLQMQNLPPLIIKEGENLLGMISDSSDAFLQATIRPFGIIHKAKLLAAAIPEELTRLKYEHHIDLAEKSAIDHLQARAAVVDEEQAKAPFVSPVEAEMKTQYVDLLEKNIIPIAAHIRKEQAKMLAEIRAFIKLNTNSVFTYIYDEEKNELTGSIKDIASKTIQINDK